MYEKLHQFMAKCNLPADHVDLNLDGQIHRYGKNGSHDDKDEWYKGYELDNGEIYCTFGTWSYDQEKYTYKSWEDNDPGAEKNLEKTKLLREKYLEEERKQTREALEYTKKVWESAPNAPDDHPYLKRKGVKSHGIKIHNGKLIVPRYDSTGALASVQTIDENGLKKNAAHLPCKSTYLTLGERQNPDTIRFCEGYATAATLYEQTGDMVVACFSCGNIFGSTFLVREKYPNASLILNADKKTEKICEKWKKQYGGDVQVPHGGEGTDFNDLFNEKGKEEFDKQVKVEKIVTFSPIEFIKRTQQYPERKVIFYANRNGEKDPIFIEARSTLIYGAGGSGKSMFAFELAFAAANGQSIYYWKNDEPRRVFFLDTEMDYSDAAQRMEEIITRRNITEDNGCFTYYNLSAENVETKSRRIINLYCQETRNKLDREIDKHDIIFIDNLQNATRDYDHEGKENSSSAWFVIHDWMKAWQDRGKTFFVIHHENRSGGYRGTSRLDGDFDNRIRISSPDTMPAEGFELIFNIEKGRSIKPFHIKKDISAHRLPTCKTCYGWKMDVVSQKKN